jgi:dsDNA-binding SOS-regulon protein
MANLIKRVVVASYETTDGRTFTDKAEAAKHQAELTRLDNVAALVKQCIHRDDVQNDPTLARDVAAFIVENGHLLREILPKRAKSAPAEETPVNDPPAPMTAEEALLPYNPVLHGNVSDAALATA